MTDLTIERMREIRDCIIFAVTHPGCEWLGITITDAEMIAICDIAIAANEPIRMTPAQLATRLEAGERWELAVPQKQEPTLTRYQPHCFYDDE